MGCRLWKPFRRRLRATASRTFRRCTSGAIERLRQVILFGGLSVRSCGALEVGCNRDLRRFNVHRGGVLIVEDRKITFGYKFAMQSADVDSDRIGSGASAQTSGGSDRSPLINSVTRFSLRRLRKRPARVETKQLSMPPGPVAATCPSCSKKWSPARSPIHSESSSTQACRSTALRAR